MHNGKVSDRTRVLAVDPVQPAALVVSEAARVLRGGGLVAFPTETVYGLGANALDAGAVASIFDAKGRPSTDPLIVHLANAADLARLARTIPPVVSVLASRFWPGPLTIILPKQPVVPAAVTAGLDTVAIRVPAHPVARAIIEAAAVPIAAPSANRFSRPSPTEARHVLADLDGRIDMVVDGGATQIGLESTVLDLSVSPPIVRRPGGVTLEDLRAVLPDVEVATRMSDAGEAQAAPGQLLRHYAPRARMTLLEGTPDAVRARLTRDARALLTRGLRVGILGPDEDIAELHRVLVADTPALVLRGLGSRDAPEEIARRLFDTIRTVDAERPDEILAIGVRRDGLGLAIHDRLVRAAEGRIVHCDSHPQAT